MPGTGAAANKRVAQHALGRIVHWLGRAPAVLSSSCLRFRPCHPRMGWRQPARHPHHAPITALILPPAACHPRAIAQADSSCGSNAQPDCGAKSEATAKGTASTINCATRDLWDNWDGKKKGYCCQDETFLGRFKESYCCKWGLAKCDSPGTITVKPGTECAAHCTSGFAPFDPKMHCTNQGCGGCKGCAELQGLCMMMKCSAGTECKFGKCVAAAEGPKPGSSCTQTAAERKSCPIPSCARPECGNPISAPAVYVPAPPQG